MTEEPKTRSWRKPLLWGSVLAIVLAIHLGFAWLLLLPDHANLLTPPPRAPAIQVTLYPPPPKAIPPPPLLQPPARTRTRHMPPGARPKPASAGAAQALHPSHGRRALDLTLQKPAPFAKRQPPAGIGQAIQNRKRQLLGSTALAIRRPSLPGRGCYTIPFVFKRFPPGAVGLIHHVVHVMQAMTMPPQLLRLITPPVYEPRRCPKPQAAGHHHMAQ